MEEMHMIYNDLGKTGKKVSAIGLGCEHLDGKTYEQVKEVIDAAIENGINLFDVFMPGREVRENIAKALGNRRDQVMIQGHIGSTDIHEQYDVSRDLPSVKKYFEEMLGIFGYIDFGMMFFIDTEKDYKDVFETDFVDYVLRLKEQGDIRHIGFSSHNPITAAKVISTGVPDMMMFSINPAFDMLPSEEYIFDHIETDMGVKLYRGLDPKRAELYRICSANQVGITVMKSLGGGKLISEEHSPFAKPLTVPQCIHYALSRPSVASVMVGAQTREEVQSAVSYFDLEEAEKDYSQVIATMKNDFQGNCVYCGHCHPCPVEIDIAAVNKYLDIARLTPNQVPPSVRSHYHSLLHRGDECIGCRSCEERCPFGVSVVENMKEADRLFGE